MAKELTILLSPRRIDFRPKIVEVGRKEPLTIAVDWSKNLDGGKKFWKKVTVGAFQEFFPNEKTEYGRVDELAVDLGRSGVYENRERVEFQKTAFDPQRTQDVYAYVSIEGTTVSDEVWTFDPVIIIKPWPGDDAVVVGA